MVETTQHDDGEKKSLTLWDYFVSVLTRDIIKKDSNMSYRNL